ncbi:MAG: TetR/AcrR family transcriptional regulator [Campylobacteraceae bacterium]
MKNEKIVCDRKKIIDSLSPKSKERYKKIIQAATEVFLEQGYSSANMSEIVKRAGGSLTTLYKIFDNKATLFTEVIRDESDKIFCIFLQNSKCNGKDTIEDILYTLAKAFVKAIAEEKTIYFYRIMIHEGYKNDSELGKQFLKEVDHTTDLVANYIEKMICKDELNVDNLKIASFQFLHLICEPTFTYLVFGLNHLVSDELIEKSIRQAVRIFLNGIKQ